MNSSVIGDSDERRISTRLRWAGLSEVMPMERSISFKIGRASTVNGARRQSFGNGCEVLAVDAEALKFLGSGGRIC